MLRALAYLLRKALLILALAVIALAVLVQAGRSFSYLVSDYRAELETLLSEQTDARVSLAEVNADWSGLQPVLEMQGISVTALTGERLLAMDSARLRLDIPASILAWRPVWGNVELAGGAMALRQDAQGRWRVQGISGDGPPPSENLHNQLLDILLASRRIAFNQTHLDFYFHNGEKIRLGSPSLLLENSGSFHRLLLRLDVAEHRDALFFLLEGRGDPRDARFTADAYLRLQNFPVNKLTDALLTRIGLERQQASSAGDISANLWFGRKADNSSIGVVGELTLANVKTLLPETSLTHFRCELSGQIATVNRWHLALHQSQWMLGGDRALALDLIASRDGANAPLRVQLASVDLAQLTHLLQQNERLKAHPTLTQLVDSLDAKGRVQSLELSVAMGNWSDWQLAANLEQLSVSSWNKIPAFTQVSGYLQANAHGGTVQLDSGNGFTMAFPGVYQQPLAFDSARGQVAWYLAPSDNRIYVNSGPLLVTDGAERAQGYFHLSLPWQRGTDSIDLTVYVSAKNMNASQYHKYLPTFLPEDLRLYLERGIGDDNPGLASNVEFVYRGAIDSKELLDHNVALALDINEGYFNYHPDWPDVRHLKGHLLLDNTDLYTTFSHGKIYNSDIKNASVTLKDNPADSGKVLALTGRLDGIASDGLRILRQSVLRDYVGNTMDTWYLHGTLDALVDLTIPLTKDAAGGYYNLNFDLDASTFALDNYGLEFENFSGQIFYDSEVGLHSKQLHGELFGRPADIRLATEQGPRHRKTLIELDAQASANQLAGWTEQPALLFAKGQVPLNIHLELNHRQATSVNTELPRKYMTEGAVAQNSPEDDLIAAVAITADLTRTQVDLPAPLGKKNGETGQLVINYILGEQTALADVHYLNKLRSLLHLDPQSQQLLGGAVAVGGEPELMASPALHLTGRLETLELAPWQQVLQRYNEYSSQLLGAPVTASADAAVLPSLGVPLSADVSIANQSIGEITVKDLRLQLRQLPDAWNFLLTSETLKGELNWPLNKDTPAQLSMAHLRLPKLEVTDTLAQRDTTTTATPASVLTTNVLNHLRPTHVSIKQLQVADEDYGSWRFKLLPNPDALVLTDLYGEVRGLTVAGLGAGGGTLRWQLAPERTELDVAVSATDMASVMRQWQAPPSIESESAQYQLELSWPGAPQAFDLIGLEGDVAVNIGSGRFIRDSAIAGEGLLRLMGLFNFDSLARRLRLDFSDLYKSGLTFDEITGAVHFASRQMTVSEPVLLRTPSRWMQLTGVVNLIDQTLDTRLLATLPMGGNLTVLAALAGGLPAAAGVFVISKLFEEQMNKATSLTYSITGDWDDPVTAFDRAAEVTNKP